MKRSVATSMIFLGLFLVPEAKAARPSRTCGYYKHISSDLGTCREQVRNERMQRLKEHRKAVYEMYTRSPDDLCVFSEQVPGIDGSRCKTAVTELHNFLDDWKEKKAQQCEQLISQKNACDKCADNLSVLECNGQASQTNQNHAQGSERWKRHQKELANKIKDVEDALLELSDSYAQNLQQNEHDAQAGVKNSQAASEMGASSPREALQMHGNESYSTISGVIDQIKNAQDIGQQQLGQIEKIKDNYAAESLYLAATAKSARMDMEKEVNTENARDAAVAKNTQFIDDNNSKLGSIGQGTDSALTGSSPSSTSQNLASALGGAAGGGGGGSGVQSASADTYGSGSTYRSQSSGQGGIPLNPLTANGGPGSNAVASDQVAALTTGDQTGSGDAMNSSGASVAGGSSLRDALRAKMAEQAGGKGGAVGASTVLGAKASGEAGKNGAGAVSPEKAALLTGFQPTNYSADGGAFDMAESETDAAVQEMISEFQGDAQIPGVGRGLASSDLQQLAPEILSEDSSSLFLRTSQFYTRCLKRGCVAR